MHQMPVIGLAVQVTGVLAHGRDHDAVGQGQWAARRIQCDGGKEQAHGLMLSVKKHHLKTGSRIFGKGSRKKKRPLWGRVF